MKNGMKQTEIGEIPVEWEVVALQDIAQRVKTKDAGGEHEVLTISAKVGFVRQEDRYSRYMAGESVKNYTLLKQGQFSYNKGNSLTYPFGCIYRLDNYPQALVPNVYISFELNDTADADFCRHLFLEGTFINRLKPFITSGVRGNGLLNVNAEDFFSLKLAFPPLPEQRKIAEILSTLDEKMAVMDEQLAQTQELKKGLMQRLLMKGIGHAQFKDSPLGEIPASWEVKSLEQLVDAKRNIRYGIVQTGENLVDGIPCLRVADFNSRQFEVATMIRTSPEISAGYSSTILKANDIVFPLRGRIGEVRLVDNIIEGINLTRGIALISNSSKIKAEYLLWQLRSPAVRKEILAKVNGTTLQEIPITGLKKVIVPVAPESEQRQIAEILTTVDEKIGVLQDKKAQYQTLKRGLMQQLLTGQRRVRVPTLEIAALV